MVIHDGADEQAPRRFVDPDELVEAFGADPVRMALLCAAQPRKSLNWSDEAR